MGVRVSKSAMTGVLTLADRDLVVLRDYASQYYLQAGHETEPATARLISGNIQMLQPTLYYQVRSTPVAGFWTLASIATGKYLKVDTANTGNENKLTWVDTNPNSEFVIDKRPYYFSFTEVPGHDSPRLYVLGTYHNGGMTLQQPEKLESDLIFGPAQNIPGAFPELAFEITVPNGVPKGVVGQMALTTLDLASPFGSTSSSSSSTTTTTNTVDGWAVAFLVLLAVLALLALGYGIYMLYRFYSRGTIKKRPQYTPPPPPPAETSEATVSTTTSTTTTTVPPTEAATPEAASASASTPNAPPPPSPEEAAKGGYYRHYNHNQPSWRFGGGDASRGINNVNFTIPTNYVAIPGATNPGHGSFGFF